MKHLQKVQFLLLLAQIPLSVFGQVKDYKYHTVFIYNFAKYIQWPVPTAQMTIGLFNPTAEILDSFIKMAETKSTPAQKYVVRSITSPTEAETCQIVFIPGNQNIDLSAFTGSIAGKPVLLVTEQPGLIKKGSLINFITVDGKLNIELNRSACEKAGLKVSGQLLGLAILV